MFDNHIMIFYDLCGNANRRRLEMLEDALTTLKWKAFSAIPALLHFNHPFLPGCEDGLSPHGFIRPSFVTDTFHRAGEFFPELRSKTAPPRKSQLLGLYAMGSVGTVFFTSASDIDFWVILDSKSFQKPERGRLERKLRAVEKWAIDTAGLEIHFYVHELSEIQRATFSYDSENAGEFGAILKEEFLRTAVYVAGFEPSHWHGEEPSIDFGAIPRLSTDQYLSACLTQLDKAFTKPFKSSLKIALLRSLAARPTEKMPAEIFWERIGLGIQPDPYILLLDYLWNHFQKIESEEQHNFLKQLLYLKMIAEENSPERARRNKDRIIAARFQAVGKPIDLDYLDNFFDWPFERRKGLSDEITRYLQDSLREISSYLGTSQIDPSRLRRLMRKVMLRRAGGDVLESITFSDVPSKGEQVISIVFNESNEDWLLSLERFSGRPDLDKMKTERNAKTLVLLIAFAIYNNLFNRNKTDLRIYPSNFSPRRLNEIIDSIEKLIAMETNENWLDTPSKPFKHLIVLEEPEPRNSESRRVTVLTKTTWGLIEVRTYRGKKAMAIMLTDLLSLPLPDVKTEYILDPIQGPDPAILENIFLKNDEEEDKETSTIMIVQDVNEYILVCRGKTVLINEVQELIFSLGQFEGKVSLKGLPSNETGQMLCEIFGRSARSRASIFRFQEGGRVTFLLTDSDGRCDSWESDKDDASYNLRANYRYVYELLNGKPFDCYSVEYRRGMRDAWNFSKIPMTELSSVTLDLSFVLDSTGVVKVTLGNKTIEQDSMDGACILVANLIRAARKVNRYYPPYLTSLKFPMELAGKIPITEAMRKKREIETRIGSILQGLY